MKYTLMGILYVTGIGLITWAVWQLSPYFASIGLGLWLVIISSSAIDRWDKAEKRKR